MQELAVEIFKASNNMCDSIMNKNFQKQNIVLVVNVHTKVKTLNFCLLKKIGLNIVEHCYCYMNIALVHSVYGIFVRISVLL